MVPPHSCTVTFTVEGDIFIGSRMEDVDMMGAILELTTRLL